MEWRVLCENSGVEIQNRSGSIFRDKNNQPLCGARWKYALESTINWWKSMIRQRRQHLTRKRIENWSGDGGREGGRERRDFRGDLGPNLQRVRSQSAHSCMLSTSSFGAKWAPYWVLYGRTICQVFVLINCLFLGCNHFFHSSLPTPLSLSPARRLFFEVSQVHSTSDHIWTPFP